MDIFGALFIFKRAHESVVLSQTTVIAKIFSAPQQRQALVRGWLCDTGVTASSRSGDSMMEATLSSSNH